MSNTFYKFTSTLTLIVLLNGTTLSAQVAGNQLAGTFQDWQMLMRSDVEFVINQARQEVKLIKSIKDWNKFLEQMQSDPYHPLTGIDKGVLHKFSQNLLFNKFGMAGAYVGGLEREISHYNYVRLWEYFGMTERLSATQRGYKCNSAGKMWAISAYICLGN